MLVGAGVRAGPADRTAPQCSATARSVRRSPRCRGGSMAQSSQTIRWRRGRPDIAPGPPIAATTEPVRRGRARRRADRAARPHHRLLRHRRDQRAAAGRPAAQCRVRQPDRVQERLHRRSHPRRDRRGHLHGHERDLHPAGRGRADRHLEHGRHDPHRRGLRDQVAEPDLVLCHQPRRSARWSAWSPAAPGPPRRPWGSPSSGWPTCWAFPRRSPPGR